MKALTWDGDRQNYVTLSTSVLQLPRPTTHDRRTTRTGDDDVVVIVVVVVVVVINILGGDNGALSR